MSKKPTVTVTINGADYVLDAVPLAYSTICALARKPGQELTVVYTRADRGRGGTLLPGQTVVPENGMVISAVHTGSA